MGQKAIARTEKKRKALEVSFHGFLHSLKSLVARYTKSLVFYLGCDPSLVRHTCAT